MSKLTLSIALVALASVLALPADAAGRGGGGRGGGGGGGHASGGGGGHGGGGGAHFGGGGGARFGGGGARFSGGGFRAAPHFSSGPRFSSAPRFSSGPRFSGRSFSNRGISRQNFSRQNFSRQAIRSGNRGVSRSFSNGRSNRSFAIQNNRNNLSGRNGRFNANSAGLNNNRLGKNTIRNQARTRAVSNALSSRSLTNSLSNRRALHNPQNRSRLLANAALAGHNHGRNGGWWRHRHGGFGWVGPVFWPFAYYDFYDYAWWGDDYDYAFWDYGYDDIYAGIFSPYGYDDYAGYAGYLPSGGTRVVTRGPATQGTGAPPVATQQNQPSQLAQMCGDDSSDIAGLPVDQFRQAIQPNADQQAALDELARASAKAAQDIKNACPSQVGLTAPTRLALMEQRIQAMIGAVQTVQQPLDKLYGLLNDEQKARIAALGSEQRQARRGNSLARSCNAAQGSTDSWPTAELDRTLHLTDAQRESLTGLQNASAKAAEMLKACPPDSALTPPARLAAIETRLETMLQAVKTVHSALNDFYAQLSDEQKASFETLGPQRTGQDADASTDQDRPRVRHVRSRRHGGVNIYGILRRFGI
ncbi:Spy/CpxP family protein refolding chaperone [Rhodoplanes sp. Z2-YC6860]|uniref:Spy/CpxP family protein refolding chaperone n=1 Tax=Rhodoplanes sp. Z2-YC6860 TaxID=674703 RepID=UPI00078E4498|nr:Spy/CpxP family protein refolding chaperone [Rhodoplanes sp. Z2-YC6860]AMN38800.1 exonuclease VII, large subunit [Rhodoplanes sp. Z2-YC6860]